MKQRFYTCVWRLSEWSGVGLGCFAPFVFERMIGIKGERQTVTDFALRCSIAEQENEELRRKLALAELETK